MTETRYTQARSWCGVGGGPVQTTALLQRTGSQDRASSATVRPRQRLCRPQARHLLTTSPRSQPAPAALVWRQPHGSRNKGAVSRLPGRVGETAALWHRAWKAVHFWMQEASSTQIFCGLAPQPNCSGAAHDLKVIKEDVGDRRACRRGVPPALRLRRLTSPLRWPRSAVSAKMRHHQRLSGYALAPPQFSCGARLQRI